MVEGARAGAARSEVWELASSSSEARRCVREGQGVAWYSQVQPEEMPPRRFCAVPHPINNVGVVVIMGDLDRALNWPAAPPWPVCISTSHRRLRRWGEGGGASPLGSCSGNLGSCRDRADRVRAVD